ncbi:MAG: hypothetical protein FJW37_05470 [Acidobacteria bacterium]|nr:hypothetical protein [Acidobacteriota bacterium]
MVKSFSEATVKCVFAIALTLPIQGQTDADRERRLAELERKARQLDGSYAVPAAASFDERLGELERIMDRLLASREAPATAEAAPATSTPVLAQDTPPLQAVSVMGASQTTGEGETRLPVAGYMEAHFNKNSGEPGQADFHRFVLLFGHSFSSRIKFWSELELEHSLVEGGEEKGELALEQAYLDFLVKPWLNFRGGMLLAPVGIVNERHEPPSFNGVERPFVETLILPATWRELGAGITGDLGRGFRYRGYMISALDPNGFSAEEGIRGGRTLGFQAPFRNPAAVARMEYAGVRRLTLGISGYTGVSSSELVNVTPRVSIASVDGRYSNRRVDFRGLFANSWISRSAELNARLEALAGFNPNVAKQLRGWYVEPAVHVFPRRFRTDLILFTRYEKYNTQHRMPAGYVPLQEFNRASIVTGLTFKPNADVAVKLDYVFNRNASSVIRPLNGFNVGLGWWF